MVKVKICGLTSKQDLKIAQGADAQGFIVNTPQSSRNIELKLAKKLVHLLAPFSHSVLVTTTSNPATLRNMVAQVGPDALQVHCELDPNQITTISRSIGNNLKVYSLLSISNDFTHLKKRAKKLASAPIDALLLDTAVKNKIGGTGRVHDWHISRKIRDFIYPFPVILAGGITPENVTKAIQTVRPYGIDVASGVETNGPKSRAKVDKLLRKVRSDAIE